MMKQESREVRFKQIVIAQFTTSNGMSYSTLGLSENGCVYRYDPKCKGWLPWSMKEATCMDDHPAGR